MLTAFFSVGFYQYDEHYQILEFLSYLQGRTPELDLTWEFDQKMRGWIQPYFYFVILSPFKALGIVNESFSQAAILRISTAIIGAFSQYYLSIEFFRFLKREGYTFQIFNEKYFLFVANFLWFLPFLHARTSSENFSGIMISLSLLYFLKEKKNHFLIGFFGGLSFLFRYQMGLVVACFWFWQWIKNKERLKNLLIQASAIIICFIIGILVDYLGYGEWTYSPWNYFYENLILGKQSGYGHAPWWKMFEYAFLKGIPPLSLFMLGAVFYFWIKKTKHFLSILTFSLVFIHLLASGKHIRFIFPIAPFIPFMIIIFIEEVSILKNKAMSYFLKTCLLLNTILLIVMIFKLPGTDLGVLKTINKFNISQLYYLGEHPFIKTPGPLNFYLDQKTSFKNYDSKTEDREFYLTTDRIRDYKDFTKNKKCQEVYLPRLAQIKLKLLKDKNRFWSMLKCPNAF